MEALKHYFGMTQSGEIIARGLETLGWKCKATFQKDFKGHSASDKDVELEGIEILHFEGDKIKEARTVSDLSQLAQ
jgi:SnoaL-like polyketide cyclase